MKPFAPPNLLWLAASAAQLVTANTEKVIFLGPPAINVPLGAPTISDLNLDVLTPDSSSIRTNLTRVFPTIDPALLTELDADADGKRRLEQVRPGFYSWFVLDGLSEGQRYELRVCWSALQPTSFSLDVFEVDTVWQIPQLIRSLNSFSRSRLPDTGTPIRNEEQKLHDRRTAATYSQGEDHKSILFLRVSAAADYFTDDLALMQDPPPVLVDVILDPYLYNILPHSLMLTGVYVVLVAILSFYVARWIASYLEAVADELPSPSRSKKRN
ncbi:hypothetical protein N3K66_003545 [Trichothecium roseum]|uniref:Uncharacterized protein n=1 Tax=Trichothecium roseum TaxID=47278 RepID=A0ACC0V6A3_9HYPO|nr:hypothetical protein N3K66_003545 [Trichothecium roseum]